MKNHIYSDVADQVSSVVLAKEIVSDVIEERDSKKTTAIVLTVIGLILVAAVVGAGVFLATKNKDGERRGKVLARKIKKKLPSKKRKENLAEEDYEF